MMQYKGYLSRVDFDDEAYIFHGEVINIRDVVSFQGEMANEFHLAFEEFIEDHLAFCAERGEEPNPPVSGRFTLSLSPERHRKVVLAAETAGKGVEQWVSEVLDHVARRSA